MKKYWRVVLLIIVTTFAIGARPMHAGNCDGLSIASPGIGQNDPPLTAGLAVNDVTCYGYRNGSINLTVSGGSPPYQYRWSNGAVTEDLYGLGEGRYEVSVTDRNGNQLLVSSRILEPQPLEVAVLTKSGAQQDGVPMQLQAKASGGAGAYKYSWTHEQGSGPQDPDVYRVLVVDHAGCSANSPQIALTEHQGTLLVTVQQKDVSCSGTDDGSARVAVIAGKGPFEYKWSNGATTPDVQHLIPGNYSVHVRDRNGAQVFLPFTIRKQTDGPELFLSVSDATCHGLSDGKADLLVLGGSEPFAYKWSNGSHAKNLIEVPAGIYEVEVTDFIGCEARGRVLISEPAPMEAGLSVQQDPGTDAASVSLNVMGGRAPYACTWSDGYEGLIRNQVIPGTYTLQVTDNSGCSLSLPVLVRTRSMHESEAALGDQRIAASGAFISPNPAAGNATLNYWSNGNSETTLNLFDLAGRRIVSQHIQPEIPDAMNRFQINLSSLKPGIYFYELQSGSQKFSGKLNVMP